MGFSSGSSSHRCDVAIVGGGLAGLTAALAAAAESDVLVLSKGPLIASSTWLAQGGVAAAMGADDSPELHAADTVRAGRGLCRERAVGVLTEEAPARIVDLLEHGVELDEEAGLEGGHSRRRVLHAGGAETGARVAHVLAERVLAHPRIRVLEGVRALEVWASSSRCVGVLTDAGPVPARATVLATGGASALWERTTNPAGSVGDGIAMAFRAGAAVADLEFQQFHPTALAGSSLLLTEALRGEGALLLDGDGQRFTDELAPRDVVARAIAERGTAVLDLRPIDRGRFAGLMASLVREGYDPAVEPIPVAAAAHYTIGGVVTNVHGATEIPGLYAAGECSCTGVHGANRLASNSLLECLVFGRRAGLAAVGEPGLPRRLPSLPAPTPPSAVTPALRRTIWQDAGLVRDAEGLARVARSGDTVARLVAAGALVREESRGVHFRIDHPTEDPALAGRHVVHRRDDEPVLEAWS